MREIDDDAARLMARAEEVLSCRVIEAGLAANGGGDHREERRRNLEAAPASEERGSGEAGEIADAPASERDDERVAIDPRAERRVPDRADGGERLVDLA